ncbi:30S ribosomal protein S19 [Nanoarchaeota archaeon]
MAKKEFKWRGRSLEETKNLDLKEFTLLLPARQRRSLKRGFTESQKKLLKRVDDGADNIKTHCRNMIIVPKMVGISFRIYTGKEFVPVTITLEMLGHFLGEFALSRKTVSHSSPGVGATKSSSAISVK